MLVGEVGMLLPFGLPRGSAQSRGSPGNPAGPLARDRLVQDSVASEDVHADKGARLVHDLVPGRRVDLRLSGHVRVLGRSFDHRYLGCGPDRLLAKIVPLRFEQWGPLGEASVVELVGRHRYQ